VESDSFVVVLPSWEGEYQGDRGLRGVKKVQRHRPCETFRPVKKRESVKSHLTLNYELGIAKFYSREIEMKKKSSQAGNCWLNNL